MKTVLKVTVGLLAVVGAAALVRAQGTAFTYQGRLNDNGVPANGSYDLRFILYDADVGGSQVGPILTNAPVSVSGGLFTVTLDFGTSVFTGPPRWLQIGARSNGTVIDFTALSPRQELTPTPYAIFAGGASATGLRGTLLSNNIAAGSITSSMLATGSVTGLQLAPGSVNTSNLVNGAVTADKVYAVTQFVSMLTIPNPSPGIYDYFGWSVAALGSDRVIIGAPYDDTGATDSGTAYLFNLTGTLLATFTNPTPASLESFGLAVAGMGTDRVLIGVPYAGTNPVRSGVAYLFSTNGTLLTTFTNPTPASNDHFGKVMTSVGNDHVLFGTDYADEGAVNSGAAYLFRAAGTLRTTFLNPSPASNDFFGNSVAAVGTNQVLIGANGGGTNAGIAYLFNIDGPLVTVFTNPTPEPYDAFGISVAAIGPDRVLIGAYGDSTGAPGAGAAYLFRTDGTLLRTITNPAPALFEGFGHPVGAFGNDRLLIAESSTGIVHLFDTNGALLLTLTNPAPHGNPVAVGDQRVLIGVSGDNRGAPGAGAAYLFTLGPVASGLMAAGVGPNAVTAVNLADGAVVASKLDPSIGLWTAMRHDVFRSSGNVGIGNITPHHRLRIGGGPLWTSEGWQGAIELDNGAAIGWNVNASGNRFGIGQSSGGLYFFATASDPGTTASPMVYLMTIDDGGHVGINTAGPTGYNFFVNGSAGKPGGGSWSDTSDARIKKNIQPLRGALDKLTQLRGVSFEWVNPADHANQTGRQAGFVAQEVERVFPNWIQEVPGAKHDATLTPDGRVKSVTLPFEFDALTVEALRELRAENAELKKSVAELKELVTKLAAQQNGGAR